MLTAISNFALAILGIGLFILWVRALADSDGECHSDDCRHCPYEGDCPQEGRRT